MRYSMLNAGHEIHRPALAHASFLVFHQQIPQPVEPLLPKRTPRVDPLLHHREALRLHSAGAHPADFVVCTSPLFSSTCTCCTIAASVMRSGLARLDTEIGPSLTRSRIARRVGSPSAWNTPSTLTL